MKAVAAELNVPLKTFESWVLQAQRAQADPQGTMTAAQLTEMSRLRRENAALAREVEFLKKLEAFTRPDDPNVNGMR